MKLALFHNLPPGGARRTMYEIFRRLEHRVDLFTLDLGRGERWPELDGQSDLSTTVASVERHQLRVPRLGSQLERLWAAEASARFQTRLARRLDDAGYDLVIVQHDQFTSAPALLGSLRTKSVYVCHEPRRQSFEFLAKADHPTGPVGLASRMYDSYVARRDSSWTQVASAIVANSYYSAESILRAYGRPSIVSHLGVDVRTFVPASGPRSGVLAVGALDRLKGHLELVRALGVIPTAKRPTLTIVYERAADTYTAEVVEAAEALDVELILRRNLSEQDLIAAYQTAAVTACVAYLEPLGLTALESMACGTPVVAVREGGYRETVSADAGLCVDRSTDALATAIDEVVSGARVYDPCTVRAAVESYWTWDHAASRFDQSLRHVVGHAPW